MRGNLFIIFSQFTIDFVPSGKTLQFFVYPALGLGTTDYKNRDQKLLPSWLKHGLILCIVLILRKFGFYLANLYMCGQNKVMFKVFLRTASSIDLISLKIPIVGGNLFKNPGFKSPLGKVKFFCPIFFSFSYFP